MPQLRGNEPILGLNNQYAQFLVVLLLNIPLI
jgi:hypothetical protein